MMGGVKQYHETCVCGASITLSENFEFMSLNEMANKFHFWQREHSGCLRMFQAIQDERLKQLRMKNKMLQFK